jgi:hypothetical protein
MAELAPNVTESNLNEGSQSAVSPTKAHDSFEKKMQDQDKIMENDALVENELDEDMYD